MSETKKPRIGFVGVGGMGQAAHLRHYAQVPECEVVALAELKPNTGKAVAARYGIPGVYTSWQDMLANEKLDGIVAAQQFTTHGSLMPQLLAHGIPILTEKPLAGSIECGEKIVDAMHKANTWMMIAYHKRSDPAAMAAKAEIERLRASGELGRMTYVRVIMPAGDWVANGFLQNVWADDAAPEGIVWDAPASDMDKETYDAYITFVNYYIHQVNFIRYMLGETWRVNYAAPSGLLLAGESASGITCALEMSPYQTTVDWQEEILVCFEKGWVKIALPAPLAVTRPGTIEIYRDPGNGATPVRETWQMPWVGAMLQQARNFVDALRGNRNVACCTAEDALEDLRLAREYIRIWKGK